MIRVNLLPYKRGRESQKSVGFRRFLYSTGAALVVVMGVTVVYSTWVGNQIDALEQEKATLTARTEALRTQSAAVRGIEQDREAFENKINVIRSLKKGQQRPVRFLDEIALKLPEKVWLIALRENADVVTIQGRALANSDIVEMIGRMKQIPFLTQLQLVESRRIVEAGASSYEFTLSGRLTTTLEAS